jgi:hypothetical protein
VGYALSSETCYPGDSPRTTPLFASIWEVLLVMNIAALLVGLLGILLAYRNWSATRHEHGGDSQFLIERGEGRTRFLAMCGLFVGACFVVATAFASVTLVLSPLCR